VPQSSHVSNAEFLTAVFGEFASEAHVTGFSDPPDAMPKEHRGLCWAGRRFKGRDLQPDHNNYFVISTFAALEENGRTRHVRRKAQFLQGHCVVVDDVGTKVTREAAARLPAPSWRLETSPGNEQWGYILDKPCEDGALFSGTLALMVAKGLSVDGTDPGMKGVTRYVRLPVGVNRKSKYGPMGVVCKMQEWQPERHYSITDLLAGFGATEDDARALAEGIGGAGRVAAPDDDFRLKAIERAGLYRRPIGGKLGWHEIECPWLSSHSDGDDSGTAVFVKEDGSYGFKCHHGGCSEKHFDDVDTWLKAKNITGFDDVDVPPSTVESVKALLAPAEVKGDYNIHLIDWDVLAVSGTPTKRKWVIENWIGVGYTTVLYGRGGVGKSLLAMQIAMGVAKGTAVLGMQCTPGRVLAQFCEDDGAELWRRAYRVTDGNLRGMKAFECEARVGRDNVLIAEGSRGLCKPTDYYLHLARTLHGAQALGQPYSLLVLDNISQMIAVPENERPIVTQAMNYLNALASHYQCAILLLGHTAKPSDSEFSGSTAWENTARGRLLLDRQAKSEALTFSVMKSNYSARDTMELAYHDGRFVRTDSLMTELTPEEQDERTRRAEECVIAAARHYMRSGISFTNERTSPGRYMPKLMAADALDEGRSEAELRSIIANLIDREILFINTNYRNASRRLGTELLLNEIYT
jgi:hypothetical protein